METIQIISSILSVTISLGTLCTMIYGFSKFLSKPKDTILERLSVVEAKLKEVDTSLIKSNDKFEQQASMNEVIIHSVMALIEFEIQYCLTEDKELSKDLEKARDDLHNYLARK